MLAAARPPPSGQAPSLSHPPTTFQPTAGADEAPSLYAWLAITQIACGEETVVVVESDTVWRGDIES